MQLIGMLDSPFVRRTAITARFLGIPLEHRSLSVFRDYDEIRAIIRSRGNVTVSPIAQHFGGEGHKNSASFALPGGLNEAHTAILEVAERVACPEDKPQEGRANEGGGGSREQRPAVVAKK